MKKSIFKSGIRVFRYTYTILIWLLCLFFVKCIIPQPINYLGSESEQEACDIYTERCPRSGSGFDLTGSGGSTSRVSLVDLFENSEFIDYAVDTVSAIREICNEYDSLFEDIERGLRVTSDECIEFKGKTVFCPIFDYTRGCLRVREIDPIKSEVTDNFDAVCIDGANGVGVATNVTGTELSNKEKEELIKALEEIISGDASHQGWLQERDDLTEPEFNTWRGTGDGTCGGDDLSNPSKTNLESNAPNDNIRDIYQNRTRARNNLDLIERRFSEENRLKRNAGRLSIVINKITGLETSLIQIEAEKHVCEEALKADNITDTDTTDFNNHIKYLEGQELEIQRSLEEDDQTLHALSVEVLDYFYDRLSQTDRKDMVERLLERQKRDFRRALVLCIYTEDSNCLSSIEAHSVTEVVTFPDFPQSIETRNFIIRKWMDVVSRKMECENGLQYVIDRNRDGSPIYVNDTNNENDVVQFETVGSCLDPTLLLDPAQTGSKNFKNTKEDVPNIKRKDLSEYEDELLEIQDEVDHRIQEFQRFFITIFAGYFTDPYGVACSEDQLVELERTLGL